MATQTEEQLEEKLMTRLAGAGYQCVVLADAQSLIANLKKQLEKHNKVKLSDDEFKKVLSHLNKGNTFKRAKTMRDRFCIKRDDGSSKYLRFINMEEWCKNEFQVTNQLVVEGKKKNRYDVTILINGLPLVHIELKRRGMELKEAFNQINRYQRDSFGSEAIYGLFQYVQIFVISNGVNTKYYANNPKQNFKQTFYWAKKNNELITNLEKFTDVFLEPCHIAKMICRYTVLQEIDKILMVLRPYQYYAVEAIIDRVKTCRKNGYIWHTTGSGKTLTSFKASQILTKIPKVHKVVFVVDRVDLDHQTMTEFNKFSEGSIDGTENTTKLVKQFDDDNTPLIITTIQKLNNAITRKAHRDTMEEKADKRIVFIFDECHRSQFGDTHKNITAFFNNAQMFGFTGTPIFKENAVKTKGDPIKRTTADLFGDRLHSYVLPDAIRDENVLRFSVEYWGKIKRNDGSLIDERVAGIDTKEFFESSERIEHIVDWIIQNHSRKTHDKAFSAILAVGSIDMLIKYYDIFKKKRDAGEHDLRVATIFSYASNEEDKNADGGIAEPDFNIAKDTPQHAYSREKLDEYIAEYNEQYGTSFSTSRQNGFYTYYKDIGKRIKDREKDNFEDKNRIDILLVVNMFLTGFDAKKINTFYADKNLHHHGLIQAFSRTNRILNEKKSHGNIVCFRNLKEATDEAIQCYSDNQPDETILLDPYEDYVIKFNGEVGHLLDITPNINSVDKLKSEEEELQFIKAFRTLMRTLNILQSFTDFTWSNLRLTEQQFNDYKSKYLDLYEKSRNRSENESVSILEEVSFELELIRRDEINVSYIISLLVQMKKPGGKKEAKQTEQFIANLLNNEVHLRSKRELIQRFINEYMGELNTEEEIKESFVTYWKKEEDTAFAKLCENENLKPQGMRDIMEQYKFNNRVPMGDDIIAALKEPPKILERRLIIDRVKRNTMDIIHTFDDAIGGL